MSPWKKTFYAAMVAQIFSIMGFMFIIPFLPFYIRELGVTEESAVEKWSGIIGGAAAVTLIIFSPIWGSLGDRYGRRLMVMRAMLGGTVVLVCMGLAQNVTQLLAARLLQGALTGTVSASTALVASVAPTERSGYALGMMQAAVFVGASCGPLLGGVISDQWGYRASCFVAAGMLLVGGLFIRFGARRDIIAAEADPGETPGRGFLSLLGSPGFLVVVFILFTIRFANSAASPIYALFVEQIHGSSESINTITGLILFTSGIAGAFAAALIGRASDSWGHRRVLIVCSLAAAAVITLNVAARTLGHLFALRILFGLAAGGMIPAANAIIRKMSHDRHLGKAFGLRSSLSSIGWALGPVTGGYMAAAYGLRAPFAVCGAALVLAALLSAGFLGRYADSN